ncbi:hypothetical protein ES707_10116 [subsurface metagenome]
MLRLSTNPGTEVKPKPTAFSALPDSDDIQLKIAMADIQAKSAEMQDLQNSGPTARAVSGLKLDILIRGDSAGRRGISHQAEQLRGIFIACQGKGSHCWPSDRLQADLMGLSERQVRRLRYRLKAAGLLKWHWQDHHRVYSVVTDIVTEGFLWVGINWVQQLELSPIVSQLLAFIRWRRFEDGAAQFKVREAAEFLGVSVDTIRRARAVLVALGFLQVSKRPGRGSRGNIYRLTLWAEWKIGVFGLEKKVAKCPTKLNHISEGDYSYANAVRRGVFSLESGLSFDPALDQKSFEWLDKLRTHRSVAKLAVVDWRHDPESVRNMFINTICKQYELLQNARKLGLPPPQFNLAGYNLGGLNNAHREHHGIPLSKPAKAFMATAQGRAAIAAGCRLTEAEFEQRKKEQIRALRSTPAKPHTPGKSAIPAQNRQFRDKKAVDEHLRAVQAAARSRSRSYQKYANSAQKADFSLDKAG